MFSYPVPGTASSVNVAVYVTTISFPSRASFCAGVVAPTASNISSIVIVNVPVDVSLIVYFEESISCPLIVTTKSFGFSNTVSSNH